MRKFSLLATTAVAVAALSTTATAQGRGTGKAPTAKAPNVSTGAPTAGGPSTHGSSGSNAGSTGHSGTTKTSGPSHGESHGTSKKPATTTASTSEHVQWYDHDDGEHRHDIDSTAHVRAQCDLHEDLEEPQPAHQSEGDAADGDDDRGGQHRVPQSGTVHRGTERVEKPGARLRSAQRRDDCGWPQSRSGSKASPDSSGTGTGN